MPSGSSQRAICYHGNGDHIILKHLLASRGDISSLANVLVNVSEQIGKQHLIKKADWFSKSKQIESCDLFT